MKNYIKGIFQQFPKAKELYQDAKGNLWTEKATAEAQSKGGKVKILKRNEYITKKVKDDTANNN